MVPHPEFRRYMIEEHVAELKAAAMHYPRRSRRSPSTSALELAGAVRRAVAQLRRSRPVPAYWTE